MGARFSHAAGIAGSRMAGMRLPARDTVTARLILVRDVLPGRGLSAGSSEAVESSNGAWTPARLLPGEAALSGALAAGM